MNCINCNCEETYVKCHHHKYTIKGKKIIFDAKRRFCKNCNNLIYDKKLDNEASLKAIDEYNQKYGIPKEKIVKLRKDYKLSQSDFAKIIGCAKKTLISYEKGKSIPNDNFMITLKSLINNPSNINYLIEASESNIKLGYFSDVLNIEPTEYNGYTILNKDKIMNLIMILAKNGISKTKLLKEIFYIDFLYYKNNACSITGLSYAKLNFGPVPDNFEELIDEIMKSGIIDYNISFKNDYEIHTITSKKKANENVFDKNELLMINNVKEYFKDYKTKEIVELSHKEEAFKNTDYYKNISYDYAFDIDIM